MAQELRDVVARADALLAQMDEQDAVAKLVTAIESITATADTLPDLVSDAQQVLQEAADLPLEDLIQQAGDLLGSAQALIEQDSTRAIPAEVTAALDTLRATLTSAQAVVEGENVQVLTSELASASERLNALLTRVDQDDVIGDVSATLTSIDAAAASLPPLTEDARALIAQARELPLTELSDQISDLLTATQQIIDQGSARAIPSEITATLGEMRTTIEAVRALAQGQDLNAIPTRVIALTEDLQQVTGRVTDLLATLDANDAAQTLSTAIDNVAQAADGLPTLVDQARNILAQAEDVPLEDLTIRASDLLAAAEAVLDQPSTRQVPAELNNALSSLRATLDEFRAGGVVENTNAALASARQAAEAVAEASVTLPELSQRFGQLAAQASVTLANYDRASDFSRDVLTAIRQVSAAAEAVYRLSRQIERNPNSLLFGR